MTTFLIFENTSISRQPRIKYEGDLSTSEFLHFSVGEEFDPEWLIKVLEDNKVQHTFMVIQTESEYLSDRERFSSDSIYYTSQRKYFITIPDESDAIFVKMAAPYLRGDFG